MVWLELGGGGVVFQVTRSTSLWWHDGGSDRTIARLLSSSNWVLIKRTSRGQFRSRFGLWSSQTNPSTLHSVHVGLRDVTRPSFDCVPEDPHHNKMKRKALLSVWQIIGILREGKGRRHRVKTADAEIHGTWCGDWMRGPPDCYFWEQ